MTDPRVLELLEAAKSALSVFEAMDHDDIVCAIDLRAAIASLESSAAQEDWIEIKEGCEMPKESGDLLVMQLGAQKVVWQNGEGWFDQGRCFGTAEDMGITHYRFLPTPPSTAPKDGN